MKKNVLKAFIDSAAKALLSSYQCYDIVHKEIYCLFIYLYELQFIAKQIHKVTIRDKLCIVFLHLSGDFCVQKLKLNNK